MSKRTDSHGLGSLATGAITALALAVQTGLAAVVGVIIARELGRTAETDGFFAAYAVYIVLALAANATRVAVLPRLARARRDRRLSSETAAYARALGAISLPVAVAAVIAATPTAALLTGFGPEDARDAAASTLPWLVVAGICQLLAGLLASALAALDDYVTAACAYSFGSLAGLVLILALVGRDGVDAIAWGMALNAALAASIPALVLWRRARSERMPTSSLRPPTGTTGRRLAELGSGIALPLALQVVYLLCLPVVAHEGVGTVSSFAYAYLIASAVVAVAASSIGLVTAVPLTRAGLDPGTVARHVTLSSFPASVATALCAGVFAVGGAVLLEHLLGGAYGASAGEELGDIIVALAPFMIVSAALSVTFPLVFVGGRARSLPLVACAMLAAQLPLSLAGRALAGTWGVALALAASIAVALVASLVLLDALAATIAQLARSVSILAAIAVIAYGAASLLTTGITATIAGTALFVGGVALVARGQTSDVWRYLRALG